MRFQIGAKQYSLQAIEEISLADLLRLEAELAEAGRPLTIADIYDMDEQLQKITNDDERKRHPSAMMLLAVTIWASRRKSGDDVTFLEAVSFPMRQLKWLPDPQDRKAAAKPGPTRPASARAAKQAPAGRGRPRSKTASAKASTRD